MAAGFIERYRLGTREEEDKDEDEEDKEDEDEAGKKMEGCPFPRDGKTFKVADEDAEAPSSSCNC
jgi:hypothetical protein